MIDSLINDIVIEPFLGHILSGCHSTGAFS